MRVTAFSVDSATQITLTIPPLAVTAPFHVQAPSVDAVSSASFTVLPPAPSIISFSPGAGVTGSSVVITGTNFLPGVGLTVKFNGVTASITRDSVSQITAVVPSLATSGFITVQTTGGSAPSPSSFTVLPPAPFIGTFLPPAGPPGTAVILTGSNFLSTSSVTFNLAGAAFAIDSPTQITCTVPRGATDGPIAVTTPSGTANSAPFDVTPPLAGSPSIDSFTPAHGQENEIVTLTGTNFTGTTGVTIGGLASRLFVVDSDSSMRVLVPNDAPTGQITVTNASGSGSSATPFVVDPYSPSTLTFPLYFEFTFNPEPGSASAIYTIKGYGQGAAVSRAMDIRAQGSLQTAPYVADVKLKGQGASFTEVSINMVGQSTNVEARNQVEASIVCVGQSTGVEQWFDKVPFGSSRILVERGYGGLR